MTESPEAAASVAAGKVLTPRIEQAIRDLCERYPSKQAVTLPALHLVNQAMRHVPLQAVVEIAQLLDLAPAQVQDTLSFYGFFKQDHPHGETRAWICRSVSCALRGSDQLLEEFCARAGIEPGGTTQDGKLTVEAAECLGACEYAPCMLAGDELHRCVDETALVEFLKQVRSSA